MPGNTWSDAVIIGEFIKSEQVVGLHIRRGNEASAYHFSSIEERLNARREAIGRELGSLDNWIGNCAADETGNADYYTRRTGQLMAERRHIEALWQQVRSYMETAV